MNARLPRAGLFPSPYVPAHATHQSDDRQRVLDATDIVRLVAEHVSLKPKGREHVCLCPFHDDRNPSCYVVPHKQIFHCFVCGAGGNAIDFVMKFHQLGFREALQLLADRAGVTLTPFKGSRENQTATPGVAKQDIAAAGATALDFFRAILNHETHGAETRDAIQRRGFSQETADAFELGASPDRWDGLLKTIEKKGLDPAPFTAAGLLKTRESGGLYDAFRHRWVFPIRDQVGRVVAFGGRKLREEDEPKYLNSSETPIFDKSSTCYGLPQATSAIRESRRAVVVEGYTDVIACHQAGERNVVATLGTALTPKHARILRRLCDEVVLVFDGDDAGQRAADRALEIFFAEPIDVRIAVLPGGADPADLVSQEDGAEKWRDAIESAADALDFRFTRMAARLAAMTPTARLRAVEEDIAALRDLGLAKLSPIRRKHVVRRLAQLAGVDEGAVSRAFQSLPPQRRTTDESAAHERTEPAGPAEHLAAALLAHPPLRTTLLEADTSRLLAAAASDARARAIVEAALSTDPDRALRDLDNPDHRAAAVAWTRAAERLSEGDPARLKKIAEDCLAALARLSSPPAQKSTDADTDQDAGTLERINALRTLGGNPTALAAPGIND